MTRIGIAVSTSVAPAPYADAAASAARVSPAVAAGADDAIPITVSCTTPMASGSSRPAGPTGTGAPAATRGTLS